MDLLDRIDEHHKDKLFTDYRILAIAFSADLAFELEKTAIKFLQPEYNDIVVDETILNFDEKYNTAEKKVKAILKRFPDIPLETPQIHDKLSKYAMSTIRNAANDLARDDPTIAKLGGHPNKYKYKSAIPVSVAKGAPVSLAKEERPTVNNEGE